VQVVPGARASEDRPRVGQDRPARHRAQLLLAEDERRVDQPAGREPLRVPRPAPAHAVGRRVGGEDEREVDVGQAGQELRAAEAGPRVRGRTRLPPQQERGDELRDSSMGEHPHPPQRRAGRREQQALGRAHERRASPCDHALERRIERLGGGAHERAAA
jgi:hypothetical protein